MLVARFVSRAAGRGKLEELMPALLTRMSRRPYWDWTVSAAARTDSEEVTSRTSGPKVVDLFGVFSSKAMAVLAASSKRLAMIMWKCGEPMVLWERVWAVAKPSPLFAPWDSLVTSLVLFGLVFMPVIKTMSGVVDILVRSSIFTRKWFIRQRCLVLGLSGPEG